ncbi:hypothetical protein STEG23_028014, partial [Scotinomys teguina]
ESVLTQFTGVQESLELDFLMLLPPEWQLGRQLLNAHTSLKNLHFESREVQSSLPGFSLDSTLPTPKRSDKRAFQFDLLLGRVHQESH